MDEAEHCDRIAIIDHGKIVAIDTPEALKASVGKDRVQIQTDDDEAAIAALASRFGIEAAVHEGTVTFSVAGGEQFVPRLFAELGVAIRRSAWPGRPSTTCSCPTPARPSGTPRRPAPTPCARWPASGEGVSDGHSDHRPRPRRRRGLGRDRIRVAVPERGLRHDLRAVEYRLAPRADPVPHGPATRS